MLCRKCGNELKMGAKFCYSCGYYIDEDEDYDDDEFEEGSKKKKKNRLSFKERLAKRKEEKQLAKEAKIRQKEIEAEEKEREKMAAEYEKEQKIKEFYQKEQQAKLRAERRAKAFAEKEREKELERQKQIEDSYNERKSKFDEEMKHKIKFSKQDDDDDNEDEYANFSYGTADLIDRSPGLGVEFEESDASIHVKEETDLSFDDFNVENRFKKITDEVKDTAKKPKYDFLDEEERKAAKKKKTLKDEASKYAVVILASIVAFVVIFFLVYTITNSMSKTNPEPTTPVIVEDTTVLLGNCTVKIPGDSKYNVEGNNLYVGYEGYNLSFTVSKDDYDSYSSDLTVLSKDFEKRKYTVSSSDKREVNGKEFIVYKIIVKGESKHFYLTKVGSSYVAMGMIEINGSSSIEDALKSISKIVFSVKM